MKVSSIPAYLNTDKLTIVKAAALQGDDQNCQIVAQDPEGDSFTLTRELDTSFTMPEVTLTVAYQEAQGGQGGQPSAKPHQVYGEEAAQLYWSLQDATPADGVDLQVGMWILSDLAERGQVGGAA